MTAGKDTVECLKTEVLVIGAGGAGARAALSAAQAGRSVTLVSRSPLGKGGLTPTGNGGYHAAAWPGDSPQIHAEDLISMGHHLNDPELVYTMTEEAPRRMKELEALGAKVNWNIPPKPAEPQMRYPRSLFCPGREILATLGRHLKQMPNVTILEDAPATRLLTHGGRVVGAVMLDMKRGKVLVCSAKVTVLAAGSLGEIYSLTAQEPMGIPSGSVGSGAAMAAWAGAELVDMEQIQFAIVPLRPATIKGMRSLPWERMTNAKGEEFLTPGEGPYSDQVARDIWKEVTEGRGPIIMDLRDKPHVERRAGAHPIAELRAKTLAELEATPWQRPMEVGIGPLYVMGGVRINKDTRTRIPGLLAAGEVSGNVHGGRRVSGNAFPEMIVFGARAGETAAADAGAMDAIPEADPSQVEEEIQYILGLATGGSKDDPVSHVRVRSEVKKTMHTCGHVFRDKDGLERGLKELDGIKRLLPRLGCGEGLVYNLDLLGCIDARAMVTAASAVLTSALARTESRGAHWRTDFPGQDTIVKHTVIRLTGDGWDVSRIPVSPAGR